MKRFVIAAGLVLGLSCPAFAGEPSETEPGLTDPGVVVSADRPARRDLSEEERRAQQILVRDLTREVTGKIKTGKPIARFHGALCLGVAGVKKRHVTVFSDRILDNAEKAGIQLAGNGCRPNALVVFTSQSRDELREARKQYPELFANLGPSAFKTLINARDEAFAWQATRQLSAQGVPPAFDDEAFAVNRVTGFFGRLSQTYRTDVFGAVVLIDRDATEGMTALQLADYTTLRLLAPTAEIKDEIEGAPPTIMSLFRNTSDAPRQLTAFDVAYLDSVYAIQANGGSGAVYGKVVNQLLRN